jgi:hypothetical protein
MEYQLRRLVLQSCMIRFDRDGQLPEDIVLPPYKHELLEVCGFAVAGQMPGPFSHSDWISTKLQMLKPAPLEPIMVECALDYLTIPVFVQGVLIGISSLDGAARGACLDVAVAMQIRALELGKHKLRQWLCSLCSCNDSKLPVWIPDREFPFRAAVEFNQSLWRYFAAIAQETGVPLVPALKEKVDRVPGFPYPVGQVLVRPETRAGSDLVGAWPCMPNQRPLLLSVVNAWYSGAVPEPKISDQEEKVELTDGQYTGNPQPAKKARVQACGDNSEPAADEPLLEMSIAMRKQLVASVVNALHACRVNILVELPGRFLRKGEPERPLLTVDEAAHSVTAVVDYRNAATFFPSMPTDMRLTLMEAAKTLRKHTSS